VTPRLAQTRPAAVADAQRYLEKAREYLVASTTSLEVGNHIAATGNAVHAGIAAADAIAVREARAVWRGEHTQAASYLEKHAGDDGRQAARHLGRLLPLKSTAEYDPNPIAPAKAAAAVEAARRIVAIAEQVVGAANAGLDSR
jgi:hypothetical protein